MTRQVRFYLHILTFKALALNVCSGLPRFAFAKLAMTAKKPLFLRVSFVAKGNFQYLKVAFQSPLSVLWILRCAQNDKKTSNTKQISI